MGWQQSPFVYPALVATLFSIGALGRTAIALRRRPQNPTLWTFAALAGGIAVWTATEAVAFARTDYGTKLLLFRIGHLGVVTVLPAWLLFALAYTGRHKWLAWKVITSVALVPALTLGVVWFDPVPLAIADSYLVTDGRFAYLFVEMGPLVWLFRAFGYLSAIVGSALLVDFTVRSETGYRGQTGLLIGAALLPFLGEVVSTLELGILPDSHLNYAALLTSVSAVVFAVAIFRYRLLDLIPVAQSTVFDNMRDGVVVSDDSGRIVDVNPQARQLLDPDDGGIGTQASTVVPQVHSITDETAGIIETTVGDRIVELTGTPLRERTNDRGWIVTVRDVTTRKRNERRLDRQRRRLDQLAKTVSHDLETPLDMGQRWISLLRESSSDDGSLDEEFLETGLDELEHANRRIEAIVDDLVLLTETKQQGIETEPLDVADLAHVAWHAVGGELSLAVDSSMTIQADRTKLLRLFENLFQNAVEHAEGADTVWVGAFDDGFFVEDDGCGIPASNRNTVLEDGYSSKTGGTGLGLAVVQAIAEIHRWSVRVTDRPDGGTRIEIVMDKQPTVPVDPD
jgi:signal transduction histidine kinase